MFAPQVGWSHALDRAPVPVNAYGKEWVSRSDPVIDYWTDEVNRSPGSG